MPLNKRSLSLRAQMAGVTLVEMMVAMIVSLLTIGTMVILMANTLGTGSETIQTARLTQELRSAMEIMTRDLRRANFHQGYIACVGNPDCRADLGISAQVSTINIQAGGDCFWFWLDRDGDGDLTNDSVGAFRRVTVGGVGALQMREGGNAAADCSSDAGWQTITDPAVVNVTAFSADDTPSYSETVSSTGTQNVEKILLTITAQFTGDPGVTREVADLIFVRNLTQETS